MGKQPLLLAVGITSEYKVGTAFSLNFNAYIIKLPLKRQWVWKRCQGVEKCFVYAGYYMRPETHANAASKLAIVSGDKLTEVGQVFHLLGMTPINVDGSEESMTFQEAHLDAVPLVLRFDSIKGLEFGKERLTNGVKIWTPEVIEVSITDDFFQFILRTLGNLGSHDHATDSFNFSVGIPEVREVFANDIAAV